MPIKPSRDLDEVCYPFIHESSWLCDFESTTDELCGHVGAILAELPAEMDDLWQDLAHLQPLVFHVNGSIRGRLAIEEADLTWLKTRLHHYQAEVSERLKGFVLPRGAAPVAQLHLARSTCKKAIRCLVRVDAEGRAVPERLPRMLNLMCNFFFVLTLVINQRRGMAETPFISKSYGRQGD